ncbi:MAG: IS1182 family transposase [Smithellaceae bacterium]|nr:IS1182 family transposase [Smithellaceae bacterium]
MMGKQPRPQTSLFYVGIDIDNRVRKNHPLRKVDELIDFDFAYAKVKDCYGNNGNVSIPPPIILKLMLLLIFYNVRSERELIDTLPERMDWLWFLGYDLDTEIPNHSVLSKARKRWGMEVFQEFFERIVVQCVEAGLVEGSKIFVDSSLVEADASNNSIIDTRNLKHQLRKTYKKLESRLEEISEENAFSKSYKKTNDRYMSTTDPDAAIVNRGKAKLTYQVHRAVDGQSEIITATDAAPGDVNEAHLMLPLFEKHCTVTGTKAETIVADSKYGTIENFLACHDQGIAAHITDLGAAQRKKAVTKEIFSEEHFLYDPATDTYRCPSGNQLKPKSLHKERQSSDYAAPRKVCAACRLREQCTKNKSGRTIKRHLRQEAIDMMREASRSAKSRRDIKTRQHLMERSFARATRYGFDRARWRGLWKMRIQEYLTCAIQNIQVLVKKTARQKESIAVRGAAAKITLIKALYLPAFFSNLLFLTSRGHAELSLQRT